MEDKTGNFRKQLDTLIELFKKIREKSLDKDIPGIDPSFFNNFDFVLKNYEMVKHQLTDDMLEQFGGPIKGMIENLINQLKEEVGDEIIEGNSIPKESSISEDLSNIDKILKSDNLTNSQIDELLDKRSNMQSKNKPENL